MRTYLMKCKSCDGVLKMSDDHEILFCPYCGSKELIDISDDVRKEKIRAEAKREIEKDKGENRRGMLSDLYNARQKRRQQKIDKEQKGREEERKTYPYIVIIILAIVLFYWITSKTLMAVF